MTSPQRHWIRENVTIANIVIVVTAAVTVGGYLQSLLTIQDRLNAVESIHARDMELVAATYQRKDVQSEAWQAVRDQLIEIRREIQDLKQERYGR